MKNKEYIDVHNNYQRYNYDSYYVDYTDTNNDIAILTAN